MKQIIEKYSDGKISNKYYINDRGHRHGLYIWYWNNGNLWYKTNYCNDEPYGLDTDYENGKIDEYKYYL